MVFDDRLGEVALAAHNKALDEVAERQRAEDTAQLAADKERMRTAVRDAVLDCIRDWAENSSAVAQKISARVVEELGR
jgi:hypothetical protein